MQLKHKIFVVYGEGAVTDGTSQKWFAKFNAGDVFLDNAPQLDTSVEVDSDQIETLYENSQRHATWEIANILKMSKSIKLLVKMKSVFYLTEKNYVNFLANPIHNLLKKNFINYKKNL